MDISNKLQQISEDNKFDINLQNLYCKEDTFNNFCDKVHDAIMDKEVVCHYEAMKYLLTKDASLYKSLGIANEYGYTAGSLSSEILATLLYQKNLENQWDEISEEVEDIFILASKQYLQ